MKAACIALVSMTLGLCVAPAWADEDEAQEHANARMALGQAQLTMDQAVTAALKELPDGKAVEAELELAGEEVVFEVEIISGGKHMMVALDAMDGKIKGVEEEVEETEDEAEFEEELAETDAVQAKLTLSQALAAALEQFPGGKAFEAEAECDEGKLVFDIELLSADNRVMDVEVDATTGKVLDVEEEIE